MWIVMEQEFEKPYAMNGVRTMIGIGEFLSGEGAGSMDKEGRVGSVHILRDPEPLLPLFCHRYKIAGGGLRRHLGEMEAFPGQGKISALLDCAKKPF